MLPRSSPLALAACGAWQFRQASPPTTGSWTRFLPMHVQDLLDVAPLAEGAPLQLGRELVGRAGRLVALGAHALGHGGVHPLEEHAAPGGAVRVVAAGAVGLGDRVAEVLLHEDGLVGLVAVEAERGDALLEQVGRRGRAVHEVAARAAALLDRPVLGVALATVAAISLWQPAQSSAPPLTRLNLLAVAWGSWQPVHLPVRHGLVQALGLLAAPCPGGRPRRSCPARWPAACRGRPRAGCGSRCTPAP